MKVYIWVFVLVALAGLVYAYRRLRHHHTESSYRKARDRKSVESREERDRLDIEALTRSMGEPSRGADAPSPGSPSAGAAREERGRRAAAHSSFDPDLPAPVKDSATRV